MLELRHVESGDYVAEVNGAVVANVNWSPFWNPAEIVVQGECLKANRGGTRGKPIFTLETGGSVLAEVRAENFLGTKFSLDYGGQRYKIRKTQAREYVMVSSDGRVVGSVTDVGLFSQTSGEFPDSWPVTIQVFLVWMAMVYWSTPDGSG